MYAFDRLSVPTCSLPRPLRRNICRTLALLFAALLHYFWYTPLPRLLRCNSHYGCYLCVVCIVSANLLLMAPFLSRW